MWSKVTRIFNFSESIYLTFGVYPNHHQSSPLKYSLELGLPFHLSSNIVEFPWVWEKLQRPMSGCKIHDLFHVQIVLFRLPYTNCVEFLYGSLCKPYNQTVELFHCRRTYTFDLPWRYFFSPSPSESFHWDDWGFVLLSLVGPRFFISYNAIVNSHYPFLIIDKCNRVIYIYI